MMTEAARVRRMKEPSRLIVRPYWSGSYWCEGFDRRRTGELFHGRFKTRCYGNRSTRNRVSFILPPSSLFCPFAISHIIASIYFFLSFSSTDLYYCFPIPLLCLELFVSLFFLSFPNSLYRVFLSFLWFPLLTLFLTFCLSFIPFSSYFPTSIILFLPHIFFNLCCFDIPFVFFFLSSPFLPS